jgi:LmbE family N-acetylglucosaminyl deacetylase
VSASVTESRGEPLTVLAVYAHVADTAGEAAGAIAVHADLGDAITAIVCTDGERHHPSLFLDSEEAPGRPADLPHVEASLDQIRAIKRREARRVAAILGIREIEFLGWEDGYLEITRERIAQLGEAILRVRPDLVLAPLPHTSGGNVDPHATVGRIVLWARDWAETRIRSVDGIVAHHPAELMFYPMGGEIADSRDPLSAGIWCDVWVDTTAVIERKIQALDQVVSQGYHGSVGRKIVEARDGRWGMLAGTAYAEPFLRGGRTYDSLPMPPRVRGRRYHPTDLPGDRLIAHGVPSAVAEDAFTIPKDG